MNVDVDVDADVDDVDVGVDGVDDNQVYYNIAVETAHTISIEFDSEKLTVKGCMSAFHSSSCILLAISSSDRERDVDVEEEELVWVWLCE